MNANPALASILDNLRDCNRAYINKLHRIEEASQEAAHLARISPYMSDISAHLIMDTARLQGQRTTLVDAAYSAGSTEGQIQVALNGKWGDFFALHYSLTGADECQA